MAKIETSLVRITYVQESRTRSTWGHPDGLRRLVIGAEREPTGDTLAETRLSFSLLLNTTRRELYASLCAQAWKMSFPVVVKHRKTRFFDDELLHVEMVKKNEQASV
jgi:hypothetical protein